MHHSFLWEKIQAQWIVLSSGLLWHQDEDGIDDGIEMGKGSTLGPLDSMFACSIPGNWRTLSYTCRKMQEK